MSLSQQLAEYISACFTGIWIQSHEHDDAIADIARLCHDQQWRLAIWDVCQGLVVPGQDNESADAGGSDPLAAIRAVNALATPEGTAILVLQNFHRFMQSAEIVQALARQIVAGKQNRTIVVILSPVVQIPTELEKMFVVVEHDLPNRQQLEEIARGIATEDGELPQDAELQTVLDAAAGLPESPLDGELWLDRKAFQRTVSIVRRQDEPDDWRRIAFLVFDAPTTPGPFEDRLAFLQDAIGDSEASYARVLLHLRCSGLDHLRDELARVEAIGGEGLMLRQPASHYMAGRSKTLLKVKTMLDAEARVVEHIPGRGRHKGRLGALRVELPDGTCFSVGSGFSDAGRENPPPIGSIITFRYQGLTDGGVPQFPTFVRIGEAATGDT